MAKSQASDQDLDQDLDQGTQQGTQPPAGDGSSSAPDQPPAPPAPVAERRLVAISKMGPQVFRMEWTNEAGDHQVNHVHPVSLAQTINNLEDIPPSLPEEDRRHRENIVAEARFKLAQLPDESWEGKDVRGFAKRAGIEIPKDIHALPALLAAIYS